MCKFYEFPQQMVLPQEEAELLEILGEAYVKALYNSLVKMVGSGASREEMEVINKLVDRTLNSWGRSRLFSPTYTPGAKQPSGDGR